MYLPKDWKPVKLSWRQRLTKFVDWWWDCHSWVCVYDSDRSITYRQRIDGASGCAGTFGGKVYHYLEIPYDQRTKEPT